MIKKKDKFLTEFMDLQVETAGTRADYTPHVSKTMYTIPSSSKTSATHTRIASKGKVGNRRARGSSVKFGKAKGGPDPVQSSLKRLAKKSGQGKKSFYGHDMSINDASIVEFATKDDYKKKRLIKKLKGDDIASRFEDTEHPSEGGDEDINKITQKDPEALLHSLLEKKNFELVPHPEVRTLHGKPLPPHGKTPTQMQLDALKSIKKEDMATELDDTVDPADLELVIPEEVHDLPNSEKTGKIKDLSDYVEHIMKYSPHILHGYSKQDAEKLGYSGIKKLELIHNKVPAILYSYALFDAAKLGYYGQALADYLNAWPQIKNLWSTLYPDHPMTGEDLNAIGTYLYGNNGTINNPLVKNTIDVLRAKNGKPPYAGVSLWNLRVAEAKQLDEGNPNTRTVRLIGEALVNKTPYKIVFPTFNRLRSNFVKLFSDETLSETGNPRGLEEMNLLFNKDEKFKKLLDMIAASPHFYIAIAKGKSKEDVKKITEKADEFEKNKKNHMENIKESREMFERLRAINTFVYDLKRKRSDAFKTQRDTASGTSVKELNMDEENKDEFNTDEEDIDGDDDETYIRSADTYYMKNQKRFAESIGVPKTVTDEFFSNRDDIFKEATMIKDFILYDPEVAFRTNYIAALLENNGNVINRAEIKLLVAHQADPHFVTAAYVNEVYPNMRKEYDLKKARILQDPERALNPENPQFVNNAYLFFNMVRGEIYNQISTTELLDVEKTAMFENVEKISKIIVDLTEKRSNYYQIRADNFKVPSEADKKKSADIRKDLEERTRKNANELAQLNKKTFDFFIENNVFSPTSDVFNIITNTLDATEKIHDIPLAKTPNEKVDFKTKLSDIFYSNTMGGEKVPKTFNPLPVSAETNKSDYTTFKDKEHERTMKEAGITDIAYDANVRKLYEISTQMEELKGKIKSGKHTEVENLEPDRTGKIGTRQVDVYYKAYEMRNFIEQFDKLQADYDDKLKHTPDGILRTYIIEHTEKITKAIQDRKKLENEIEEQRKQTIPGYKAPDKTAPVTPSYDLKTEAGITTMLVNSRNDMTLGPLLKNIFESIRHPYFEKKDRLDQLTAMQKEAAEILAFNTHLTKVRTWANTAGDDDIIRKHWFYDTKQEIDDQRVQVFLNSLKTAYMSENIKRAIEGHFKNGMPQAAGFWEDTQPENANIQLLLNKTNPGVVFDPTKMFLHYSPKDGRISLSEYQDTNLQTPDEGKDIESDDVPEDDSATIGEFIAGNLGDWKQGGKTPSKASDKPSKMAFLRYIPLGFVKTDANDNVIFKDNTGAEITIPSDLYIINKLNLIRDTEKGILSDIKEKKKGGIKANLTTDNVMYRMWKEMYLKLKDPDIGMGDKLTLQDKLDTFTGIYTLTMSADERELVKVRAGVNFNEIDPWKNVSWEELPYWEQRSSARRWIRSGAPVEPEGEALWKDMEEYIGLAAGESLQKLSKTFNGILHSPYINKVITENAPFLYGAYVIMRKGFNPLNDEEQVIDKDRMTRLTKYFSRPMVLSHSEPSDKQLDYIMSNLHLAMHEPELFSETLIKEHVIDSPLVQSDLNDVITYLKTLVPMENKEISLDELTTRYKINPILSTNVEYIRKEEVAQLNKAEQMIKERSFSKDGYLLKAKCLLRNNEYDKARDQFENAKKIDPNDENVYFGLAEVFSLKAEIWKNQNKDPKAPNVWEDEAARMQETGDLITRYKDLEHYIKDDVVDGVSITGFEPTPEEFEDYVLAHPENAVARMKYADFLSSKGHHYLALRNYIELINTKTLDPKNLEQITKNMSDIYRTEGDYDNAITEYTKYLDMNPTDFKRYEERASLYSKVGKYEQAIEDISNALSQNPTKDKDLYGKRAELYEKIGNQNAAELDWHKLGPLGKEKFYGETHGAEEKEKAEETFNYKKYDETPKQDGTQTSPPTMKEIEDKTTKETSSDPPQDKTPPPVPKKPVKKDESPDTFESASLSSGPKTSGQIRGNKFKATRAKQLKALLLTQEGSGNNALGDRQSIPSFKRLMENWDRKNVYENKPKTQVNAIIDVTRVPNSIDKNNTTEYNGTLVNKRGTDTGQTHDSKGFLSMSSTNKINPGALTSKFTGTDISDIINKYNMVFQDNTFKVIKNGSRSSTKD